MISIFTGVTFFFLLGYVLLLLQYKKWFANMDPFQLKEDYLLPKITFSIVIPARNEEANIRNCIQSILANNYPSAQYEILVIDDFSTDQTVEIVQHFSKNNANVRLLRMAELIPHAAQLNSYKKMAIALAIEQACGDWIITTDADCTVGPNWLLSFAQFIEQKEVVFIAAPVKFSNNGDFIQIFQSLDFLSLQGITAASVSAGFHSMCNGANLCYQKYAFTSVGGFSGIDKLASGDDMFLMHKILKAFPDKIGYLFSQESVVNTLPMPNVSSFINQRIRWASKADSYQDNKIKIVLLWVYLLNILLLTGLIVFFFFPPFILYWLLALAIKTIFELNFLKPVASFYKSSPLLLYFPLMQLPHILYTVLAGFLGKFGKYQWKGRTVK